MYTLEGIMQNFSFRPRTGCPRGDRDKERTTDVPSVELTRKVTDLQRNRGVV